MGKGRDVCAPGGEGCGPAIPANIRLTIDHMLLALTRVQDIVPFLNMLDLAKNRGEIGSVDHATYVRSAQVKLKATELSLRYGGFNRDLLLGTGEAVERAA